jgi:sucrose phosphorylase
MNDVVQDRMQSILKELYSEEDARWLQARLDERLADFENEFPANEVQPEARSLSERDAVLITYGDMVQESGYPPLQTLAEFCHRYLSEVISGIHILPFYPWSSDDGFSVIDYREIDQDLGKWEDILRLSQDFKMMFDAVINHISSDSVWFRLFLKGDPRYRDYFIVVEGNPDLSMVIRPRTTPLLTPFETSEGVKQVWTTFSADQIDLNYKNPEVLFEMIELLLFYAQQGAQFIRLDAVAFIWKQPGTTCLHLPQAHQIVQLLRAVCERVAPAVRIITETNVPHRDNIAYFGNGTNEAHLVYNFALPPLVLHTFRSGDCRALSAWADTLSPPSEQATFFNFLASHDGIGLNPVRGLLDETEIEALAAQTTAHGGFISSKTNPDGTTSPYELNINFYDALNDPSALESLDLQVSRFVCAQAIMLAMTGVPGIYFHSLVGSRGWREGVENEGKNRAINRQKLERGGLETELAEPGGRRNLVFRRYARLLKARASAPDFDPHCGQQTLDCGKGIFGLLRRKRQVKNSDQIRAGTPLICLHNVTARPQKVNLNLVALGFQESTKLELHDLVSGEELWVGRSPRIELRPYQVMWLMEGQVQSKLNHAGQTVD